MSSHGEDALRRLQSIMARLRAPDGCPWDREQTLDSIKGNLIEESYELVEAIEEGRRDKIREELGDVLLQVVFQSRICEEDGSFDLDAVAETLCEKLVRRHPHVFGDDTAEDSREVLRNWETIKRDEGGQGPRSLFEGLPAHLPALMKAHQVQRRAARVGFDWPEAAEVLDKVQEEIAELREALAASAVVPEKVREELGDLLFSMVNLCRRLDAEAEDVLRLSTAKFMRRFRALEQKLHRAGRTPDECTLEELDRVWDEVKNEE
ncbi:nucleoside triphosphate pyrophosphohydrolase [Kiritimatiella glycovorans]|uniref:Nucleoside triphosphate pyrophosphohydrolase n=1 Tax=Kiritimatiella glycovorans TaxID=1307763 RepID=A0A0G3EK52_9BACT|nr:nucleoside triphosphate pyrophosphohydrolase [Kiritimatiella glycovorans]AKJ64534.1 Nucleoside triphosphate pyrophosphohydrolase [Kiritimatiella glycovorans]